MLNLTITINTELSFRTKSGLIRHLGGPRPKSRLTVEGCDLETAQNLSLWGSETTTKFSGIYFISFFLVLAFFFIKANPSFAQQEQRLLEFERQIETAVVATDISFLKKAYADDFRFKHGTGLIDTKSSWLKSVANNKGKYLSRTVVSAEAEIHDDIGITEGTITVTQTSNSYTIHYVRIYRRKGDAWELFMHRTVQHN